MNKISNVRFNEHASKFFGGKNDVRYSVFKDFYLNLEALEKSIKKRVTTNFRNKSESETVYLNLKSIIDGHYNATKIKFSDLFKGYISCINSESYSGAIIISRAILENTAMLHFLGNEISKKLEKKDYMSFCKILINYTVSLWSRDRISVYQRTHINDALRHYSATDFSSNKSSSDIFKIYDPLSELSHPAPTSFMMYNTHINHKGKSVTEQKPLHPNEPVMTLIAYFIAYPGILVEKTYPYINESVIDLMAYHKSDIDKHFAVNKGDMDDLKKMLNK